MTTPPEERPPDDGQRFPDPRPFRRIQGVTFALIAAAALITLLSDRRPAEVRYGALVGVVILVVAVALVTRRRRRDG